MNVAVPLTVSTAEVATAPAETTSVTDVPSWILLPDASFTSTVTFCVETVAISTALTVSTEVEARAAPMVKVVVAETVPTVVVTVQTVPVTAVPAVRTVVAAAAPVDAVVAPMVAQVFGVTVMVGETPGTRLPALSFGSTDTRTPPPAANVAVPGVAALTNAVPAPAPSASAWTAAVRAAVAPAMVTVLVTETPLVVNVIVATPGALVPVRVTPTAPPAGSVPVQDWPVQVWPVVDASVPIVELIVTAPPAIGAVFPSPVKVAVIVPVVPVRVVDTAVVGATEPATGRVGTTVVLAVKFTTVEPISWAEPPAAGVMKTSTVAVPTPVFGARSVAVALTAPALAAWVVPEMDVAGAVVLGAGVVAPQSEVAPALAAATN